MQEKLKPLHQKKSFLRGSMINDYPQKQQPKKEIENEHEIDHRDQNHPQRRHRSEPERALRWVHRESGEGLSRLQQHRQRRPHGSQEVEALCERRRERVVLGRAKLGLVERP